ncbi:hypothetical protein [Burkholderia cenocepacia]|uniref:hypothetical protein n=1 Tax=Burkholderia cenocepacia TaxID=95486 RepID=UPI000F571EDA|nr:hypothetical protein [Burkholderia cenocepacia]RQU97815.1 hypothetical protein DF042_27255 [Burkholderia cenocepacia]
MLNLLHLITNASGNLVELGRLQSDRNQRVFVGALEAGGETMTASATLMGTGTYWRIVLGACDVDEPGLGYSADVSGDNLSPYDLSGYLKCDDSHDELGRVAAKLRRNTDGTFRMEIQIRRA